MIRSPGLWLAVLFLLPLLLDGVQNSEQLGELNLHQTKAAADGLMGGTVCEQGKTRVAFFHHAMVMGGVERQIILTAAAIDGQKVAMEAVLFQEEGSWAWRLEELGVPVHVFRILTSEGDVAEDHEVNLDRMAQYLQRFDIIHTWYGGDKITDFSVMGLARRAGVPVIQNLAWNVVTTDLSVAVVVVECDEVEELHKGGLAGNHNAKRLLSIGVEDEQHQQIILEGGFLQAAAGEGMAERVSQMLEELMENCMSGDALACIKRPVVTRINPGLNRTRFDPEDQRLASIRSQARSKGVVTIGRVSRLVPEKDPETLILAAQHFLGRTDVRFKVWGDGSERARLENLRDGLGLQGILEIMGSTDDVAAALAELDIFAYTTTGESVGWVVLEAMAMALPVISSEVGAVPTFVRHGETGFLISPSISQSERADELAGLLDVLLEDADLRLRMGDQARRDVLQRYDLDRFGDDYTRLYQQVAKVDWGRGGGGRLERSDQEVDV